MRSRNIFIIVFLLCSQHLVSCKKFLEEKAVQTLSTPESLEDLQALLDNPLMNTGMTYTNAGTDEYYLTYSDWQSRNEFQKDGYIWTSSFNNYNDWTLQYQIVFYANTVLLNLDRIDGEKITKDKLRGSALFYRAYSFFNIAQLYAPQYTESSAKNDLGIVLRYDADFNVASARANLKSTYQQILNDLTEASELLPENEVARSRPTRTACLAQLARVYLQMGDYSKAKQNASACLKIKDTLVDFNDPTWVQGGSSFIKPFNPEVIYYTTTVSPINSNTRAKIDSNLYRSFEPNDLRKSIFFNSNGNGTYRFKGSYNGSYADLFNGLATDEVYLMRAECLAREGNVGEALGDLNKLLSKRWKAGTFTPLTSKTADEILEIIIKERKKELIYRAIRWSDLKRLNKEVRFAVNLKRILNGSTYELKADEARYALLIPREVLLLANMEQNKR